MVDVAVGVNVIVSAVLGGRRTVLGAALGAIFLIVAGEFLRGVEDREVADRLRGVHQQVGGIETAWVDRVAGKPDGANPRAFAGWIEDPCPVAERWAVSPSMARSIGFSAPRST